jgi:hypothetical protein
VEAREPTVEHDRLDAGFARLARELDADCPCAFGLGLGPSGVDHRLPTWWWRARACGRLAVVDHLREMCLSERLTVSRGRVVVRRMPVAHVVFPRRARRFFLRCDRVHPGQLPRLLRPLAADDFVLVADALALVGLRRTALANRSRQVTDGLLVRARDDDVVGSGVMTVIPFGMSITTGLL